MSDYIADILEDNFGQNHLSEEIDSVAKQIRQRIGWELLDSFDKNSSLFTISEVKATIREVCQLEDTA